MKRLFASALLAAVTVGVATLQPTQTSVSRAQEVMPQQATTTDGPDARVKDALDTLGLKYEVGDNGVIKVVMRFQNDRTQAVYISSGTNTLGDLEIREIVSPANLTEGQLSSETANKLLRDNANRKLGAWQTLELQDQKLLTVYTAQIDANSSPQQLQAVLGAVLQSADAMEAELTGDDRF
jgi:hypothetical protein